MPKRGIENVTWYPSPELEAKLDRYVGELGISHNQAVSQLMEVALEGTTTCIQFVMSLEELVKRAFKMEPRT
jgi:hypothetical protein